MAKLCIIEPATECRSGLFATDTDGRWTWTMSRIGFVEYHRRLAKRVGVPESAIAEPLAALEALAMQNIARRLKRQTGTQRYAGGEGGMGVSNDRAWDNERASALEYRVALRWDEYMKTLPKARQATMPAMSYELGCGAGEAYFTVSVKPAGAKLRIISDFDWELCKALGKDPWSPEGCHGWSQINLGKNWLVGRYRYVLEWPNGQTVKSVKNVVAEDSFTVVVKGKQEVRLPSLVFE